jgi:hypothetical protein
MTDSKMDQILDTLDQARQRATYGAVAALLGTAPRTLMSGRERDHRHSWAERTGSLPATKRASCTQSSCAAIA